MPPAGKGLAPEVLRYLSRIRDAIREAEFPPHAVLETNAAARRAATVADRAGPPPADRRRR
jgi:hypothetical protein